MDKTVFDYSEFEEFKKQIERWPLLAIEAGRPAMEQALLILHNRIPEYPDPPTNPDGASFMTEKQRKWFFANLREGKIKGWALVNGKPVKKFNYRTGNLGRKFTEEVFATDDAVLGQIGTNVPYAPWVVGPDYPGRDFDGKVKYQARVHVERWWQFEDVIEENIDDAWQEFAVVFLPELTKLLEGKK
jgi:hypothetical protein